MIGFWGTVPHSWRQPWQGLGQHDWTPTSYTLSYTQSFHAQTSFAFAWQLTQGSEELSLRDAFQRLLTQPRPKDLEEADEMKTSALQTAQTAQIAQLPWLTMVPGWSSMRLGHLTPMTATVPSRMSRRKTLPAVPGTGT